MPLLHKFVPLIHNVQNELLEHDKHIGLSHNEH